VAHCRVFCHRPCSIPSEHGASPRKSCKRTKTDHVDALGIARFAAQKRPKTTPISDQVTQALRQLVHLRQQATQHLGDRVRNLHRAIDLTFPEFTPYVRGLDTEPATAILSRYPSASAISRVPVSRLARPCSDRRRRVGYTLARALIAAAKQTVGSLQTAPFELEVRYACQDVTEMPKRARRLETDIQNRIDSDDLRKLFTTLPGVSTVTAAAIIAEAGNPARFPNAATFASYVGVVPRLHHSGKRRFSGNGAILVGNARLRRALWMPRDTREPVAWSSLPTPSRGGKTSKGRNDRMHAQTAQRNSQRGEESPTFRTAAMHRRHCEKPSSLPSLPVFTNIRPPLQW
jgi:transposase